MELFDNLVKAKQDIVAARDALTEAEKEWNKSLAQFVEEAFPDPVTVKYYGATYTGVVKTKRYAGINLNWVRFFPITKTGEVSKNAFSPTVSHFEVNWAKDADDLKRRIIEELGIVTTEGEGDNT